MPNLTLETELGGRVAGVDEAGRGPWAGPVVAAAAIIDPARAPRALLDRLDDSKKLGRKTREDLFHALDGLIDYGVGVAEPAEIDRINILQATFVAMQRAVDALPVPPDAALIDGNRAPTLPCPAQTVVRPWMSPCATSIASGSPVFLRASFMRSV